MVEDTGDPRIKVKVGIPSKLKASVTLHQDLVHKRTDNPTMQRWKKQWKVKIMAKNILDVKK